jgi:hypothetical protein
MSLKKNGQKWKNKKKNGQKSMMIDSIEDLRQVNLSVFNDLNWDDTTKGRETF